MIWVAFLADEVVIVFVWSFVFADTRFIQRRWPDAAATANAVAQELRPFYLPALMLSRAYEIATYPQRWWDWLLTALLVTVYFSAKPDDRWRKRRLKVAEKVQQLGSRLIVVPVRDGAQ